MDTKLTLKLDKEHINKAKEYAAKQKTSLSALVEKYFAFLSDTEADKKSELTPVVKKLSGVIKLDPDFDLKREKAARLLEKYK